MPLFLLLLLLLLPISQMQLFAHLWVCPAILPLPVLYIQCVAHLDCLAMLPHIHA